MSMPQGYKTRKPVTAEDTAALELAVRTTEEKLQSAHPGPYVIGVLDSRGVVVLESFAPVHRIMPLLCAVYSVNQTNGAVHRGPGRPRKDAPRVVVLRAPGGSIPLDSDEWRVVRPWATGDKLQMILRASELFKYHPIHGAVLGALAEKAAQAAQAATGKNQNKRAAAAAGARCS